MTPVHQQLPYFSIVIPMYNREFQIARAIQSCLQQSFESFEVIVVDDGSTDDSVAVAKGFSDARIKHISHDRNRGVGAARNTGVDIATGEWVVFFDSDDELCPAALTSIYDRSIQVGVTVSRMQFMGRIDTGELSPDPPLESAYWDYVAYIKWMENGNGRRQDTMPVIRRKTFEEIKFHDDRTLEGPYHLDFMKRFNAWTFPDVVALYHQDAANQLTKADARRTIEAANDQAISGERLLSKHGEALKVNAPNIYRNHVSGMATLYFLSGNRAMGIKYSFSSLSSYPLSLRSWTIFLVGLAGAKPLAWLKSHRAKLH